MNLENFKKASESLGIGDTPLIPYEEDFDADIYVKNEAMNRSEERRVGKECYS